jgi:hypothetical protein
MGTGVEIDFEDFTEITVHFSVNFRKYSVHPPRRLGLKSQAESMKPAESRLWLTAWRLDDCKLEPALAGF